MVAAMSVHLLSHPPDQSDEVNAACTEEILWYAEYRPPRGEQLYRRSLPIAATVLDLSESAFKSIFPTMIDARKAGEFLGGLISELPIIKEWRQSVAARREHDLKKFAEMNVLLPEQFVDEYLERVEFRQLTPTYTNAVWEYLYWARFYANAFATQKLQDAREDLDRALHDLSEFTKDNFFPVPGSAVFIFQPHLKAKPQEYADLLERQLIPHAHKVKREYIAFRQLIKKHLII